MKIMHNAHIDVTDGATREDLAVFLETVPAGSKIETITYHQPADRPWESARTTVALQAIWERK